MNLTVGYTELTIDDILAKLDNVKKNGAGKWRLVDASPLKGRRVVILPDNDEPGRQHSRDVANALRSVAASVKVVELPGLPDKGDVSDWLRSLRKIT